MMKTDSKVHLNFVDQAIAFFFPGAGVRRLAARNVLSHYEAAKPSRLRKGRKANGSPNAGPQTGTVGLRGLARNLEANHDIARGALRTLVTCSRPLSCSCRIGAPLRSPPRNVRSALLG